MKPLSLTNLTNLRLEDFNVPVIFSFLTGLAILIAKARFIHRTLKANTDVSVFNHSITLCFALSGIGGLVCIPTTVWLMSSDGEEAFNKTAAPGAVHGDDPGDDPGETPGNTDRFLPCWILFLVRGSLVAMSNITFNLNILFRFFLVIYSDGFVERGRLDLKLFRQLYWLAWVTFILIEFTMFAVTPIIRGNFHYATSRGRICIMVKNIGDSEDKEDTLKIFIMKFGLVVQLVYTLRFVKRIRKYVLGQCPRNILSSIGRYPRNVLNLRLEFWCSVLGSCFPGLDYTVRKISMNQTPASAFFVNFVLLDGLLYLFYVSLCVALSRNDIPSKEVIRENYFFYVSCPRQLEPRRCKHNESSSPLQGVSKVSESPFPFVPYVRKMVLPSKGRRYKMINYVSTRATDADRQPGKNRLRSETSRREKTDKRSRFVKVEPFLPLRSEFTGAAPTHSSQEDLSKPCSSSSKTFYVSGRFNYFKKGVSPTK